MTRAFLVIASSEYDDLDNLPKLEGVVADGNNINEVFLDTDVGDYNSTLSKYLLSPTLSQVRESIEEILCGEEHVECFTLYFAGHGISQMGTYYLCLKDTFVNKLSTTALPVNHIFNVINEKRPIQSSIIIDACEAGGVADDLASLIKPEVFGSAFSPSVSLLCACMRDEEAVGDKIYGGYATQELLKHINGDVCVDTRLPFLDLVQIGRNISASLSEEGYDQTPVVWGLNLTGISTFSKNPHFHAQGESVQEAIEQYTFISEDFDLVKEAQEEIWRYYLDVSKTGASPRLLAFVNNLVEDLKTKGMETEKIGAFLLGLSEGLSMRVSEQQDIFAEVEVMALCGAAFLPILEEDGAEKYFLVQIDRILKSVSRALEMLETDLETNPDAILSRKSGLNDLYYLPLRLTKILGWLGLVLKIQNVMETPEIVSDERVQNILQLLMEHYAPSFACVSESQAPYLMMFSQSKGIADKNEVFLMPMRCFIHDFYQIKGKVVHSDISGKDILTYLLRRNYDDYSEIVDLIAQPTELLSVLFDCAVVAEMDDVLDPYMIKLDHLNLNVFVPEDAQTFSRERIENGTNITMQIGSEVGGGVFTLKDFKTNFAGECESRIDDIVKKNKTETCIAMALASFIMPDRVAWSIKAILK